MGAALGCAVGGIWGYLKLVGGGGAGAFGGMLLGTLAGVIFGIVVGLFAGVAVTIVAKVRPRNGQGSIPLDHTGLDFDERY